MRHVIQTSDGYLSEFLLTRQGLETKTTADISFAIQFETEEQADSLAEMLVECLDVVTFFEEGEEEYDDKYLD